MPAPDRDPGEKGTPPPIASRTSPLAHAHPERPRRHRRRAHRVRPDHAARLQPDVARRARLSQRPHPAHPRRPRPRRIPHAGRNRRRQDSPCGERSVRRLATSRPALSTDRHGSADRPVAVPGRDPRTRPPRIVSVLRHRIARRAVLPHRAGRRDPPAQPPVPHAGRRAVQLRRPAVPRRRPPPPAPARSQPRRTRPRLAHPRHRHQAPPPRPPRHPARAIPARTAALAGRAPTSRAPSTACSPRCSVRWIPRR